MAVVVQKLHQTVSKPELQHEREPAPPAPEPGPPLTWPALVAHRQRNAAAAAHLRGMSKAISTVSMTVSLSPRSGSIQDSSDRKALTTSRFQGGSLALLVILPCSKKARYAVLDGTSLMDTTFFRRSAAWTAWDCA